MSMTITFQQLRALKDSLPDGAMSKIAEELGLQVETVRNYFGGANFENGKVVGIHFEPGPGGGIVKIDDDRIIKMAQKMAPQENAEN
jgi:predicted transcriptional regulator